MRRVLFAFIGVLTIGFLIVAQPGMSRADTFTFQSSPGALDDLEHHSLYTWRIDGVDLSGKTITGATLTISNINNWDSNPNTLFIHLLDTAKSAGVASFIDDPTNSSPVTDITDDFANTRYHSDPKWVVPGGTADTFLAAPSFTTTATNFSLTLTNPQLQALTSYFANGNDIALGLDPDCHFFDNGVTLSVNAIPNPEPASMMLLGSGLLGLYFARSRWARRP